MSRDASITLDWADGTYVFRLAIGQLRELQEKCDAGPAHIMSRLSSGWWMVDDIVQTIRLGLIGGGLGPIEAMKLVRVYVEERPLVESIMPAIAILSSALVGAPDEDAQKKSEAETTAETSPSLNGES